MRDIIQQVIQEAVNTIVKKLDDVTKEALERKGFKFDNDYELIEFMKENCRCEDNIDLKRRVYFVNDIPFLAHYYEIDTDIIQKKDGKYTSSYGKYTFL